MTVPLAGWLLAGWPQNAFSGAAGRVAAGRWNLAGWSWLVGGLQRPFGEWILAGGLAADGWLHNLAGWLAAGATQHVVWLTAKILVFDFVCMELGLGMWSQL